jgi:hypothetical protein
MKLRASYAHQNTKMEIELCGLVTKIAITMHTKNA